MNGFEDDFMDMNPVSLNYTTFKPYQQGGWESYTIEKDGKNEKNSDIDGKKDTNKPKRGPRGQRVVKTKLQTFWAKYVYWSTISTAHGYPRIFQSKSNLIRVMWVVMTLFSVALALYLATLAIQRFLLYGVTSKIRYINELPTVCKFRKNE